MFMDLIIRAEEMIHDRFLCDAMIAKIGTCTRYVNSKRGSVLINKSRGYNACDSGKTYMYVLTYLDI